MNILFDRDQKHSAIFSLVPLRIGSGVIFHLKAELELDEEEVALLDRYKFRNALLVESKLFDDLMQALRPALLLGLGTFIVLSIFETMSTALSGTGVVILLMTVVYFRSLRERIIVRDLLNGGRTFYCDSIVDLIQKEAYLESICAYLRQILESAKNWHDREAVPIKPLDRQVAKQFILETLHRNG